MTTPANALLLGKTFRLFAGLLPTSTADSDFKLVENENDLEVTYKNDKDTVSTKSKGKITLPVGDESWQIKATLDMALVDNGFPLLLAGMQAAIPLQIRDTATNMVFIEGMWTVTDMGNKGQDKGVRQLTFTFDNTDVITIHLADGGRPVVSGS